MGSQQEVVVTEPKLAVGGSFQTSIIHCKRPRMSKILPPDNNTYTPGICKGFLTAKIHHKKIVFMWIQSKAISQLGRPGAYCCPESWGFATFFLCNSFWFSGARCRWRMYTMKRELDLHRGFNMFPFSSSEPTLETRGPGQDPFWNKRIRANVTTYKHVFSFFVTYRMEKQRVEHCRTW